MKDVCSCLDLVRDQQMLECIRTSGGLWVIFFNNFTVCEFDSKLSTSANIAVFYLGLYLV